jgi:mono/diheme cytochrome c family protein
MKDTPVAWRSFVVLGVAIVLGSVPRAAPAQDQDKAKIEAGAQTFATYCSTCHGDDLVNTGPTTFDLRKLKANERPRFENSVMNGKKQMPPWKGVISPEQIDQLWSYIRANAYEK